MLTTLDEHRGERAHRWPQVLPGGKHLLYSAWSSGTYDDCDIIVESLESGARRSLVKAAVARYLPSGHLLYARAQALYAVPFDLESLSLAGSGLPVQPNVETNSLGPGQAHFAVSDTGTLVFVSQTGTGRRLALVDLEGRAESLAAPPLAYHCPRFAPDGARLALTEDGGGKVYLYERDADRLRLLDSRFRDAEGNTWPPGEHLAWSPDGSHLAIPSRGSGGPNVFVTPAEGDGDLTQLTDSPSWQIPEAWTPDGEWVLFSEQDANTLTFDIWEISYRGGEARLLVRGPGHQTQPAVSPDGRHLVYVSDESGRAEVYLRVYDGRGPGRQISTDGGMAPIWAPDGGAVYYRNEDQVMRVELRWDADPGVTASKPRALFSGSYFQHYATNPRSYDLSPDGSHFVMIQAERPPGGLQLVLNWFQEIERVVPSP